MLWEPPPVNVARRLADLESLARLFYGGAAELGRFQPVAPGKMPLAYRGLLCHEQHMTVALERYHRSLLDLTVLHCRTAADAYARNTLLRRRSDKAVVQFGIVRMDVRHLPADVRTEIELARVPMGRVLIAHRLLRRVQLVALWRVTPAEALARHFRAGPLPGGDGRGPCFARTAVIYCNGRPAVEVLEIMPPGLNAPPSAARPPLISPKESEDAFAGPDC